MKPGDYAFYLLDASGHIVSWNDAARELKGYLPGEVMSQHITTLYPPKELRHVFELLAKAAQDGQAIDDGWRYRKNGTRFWARVVLTATVDDEGSLTGFAKVIQYLGESPEELENEAHRTRQ